MAAFGCSGRTSPTGADWSWLVQANDVKVPLTWVITNRLSLAQNSATDKGFLRLHYLIPRSGRASSDVEGGRTDAALAKSVGNTEAEA